MVESRPVLKWSGFRAIHGSKSKQVPGRDHPKSEHASLDHFIYIKQSSLVKIEFHHSDFERSVLTEQSIRILKKYLLF